MHYALHKQTQTQTFYWTTNGNSFYQYQHRITSKTMRIRIQTYLHSQHDTYMHLSNSYMAFLLLSLLSYLQRIIILALVMMMIMVLIVMVIFYDDDKRCFTEIRRIYITPDTITNWIVASKGLNQRLFHAFFTHFFQTNVVKPHLGVTMGFWQY